MHWKGRSSVANRATATISDEPEKLVFHLLLQVEVISSPQELPFSHRTFCHLVKDRLLTLGVKARVGITAGHIIKLNNHCRCHKTVTVEGAVLPLDTERTGSL